MGRLGIENISAFGLPPVEFVSLAAPQHPDTPGDIDCSVGALDR